MGSICGEGLWIKCIFATKFLVNSEKIYGSETVNLLLILSGKI